MVLAKRPAIAEFLVAEGALRTTIELLTAGAKTILPSPWPVCLICEQNTLYVGGGGGGAGTVNNALEISKAFSKGLIACVYGKR